MSCGNHPSKITLRSLGLLAILSVGLPQAAVAQPQMSFVSPRHLSTVVGSTPIELRLTLDSGVSVERLVISVDGEELATLSAPPWRVEWDAGNASRGHEIEARLTASDGTTSRLMIRTSALRINQFEEVGLVNLYALVRDGKGDYVGDLTQDDFRILENGKSQTIRRFTTERKPLRVGIVLDTSLTMEGRKLAKAKRAALDFLEVLRPGDQGLVVTFSDRVKITQDITSQKEELAGAIDGAVAEGGTALYDAIWRAAKELQGFDGRRVMVLLSDGRDEARNGLEPGSLHTVDEALEEALRSEAMVFAIGLGRNLDEQLDFYRRRTVGSILREMADSTGGRPLISSGVGELRQAFKRVADDLRNQYLLAYLSNDDTKDGQWREIQALTPGRNLEVITRKGYYAPNENDVASQ